VSKEYQDERLGHDRYRGRSGPLGAQGGRRHSTPHLPAVNWIVILSTCLWESATIDQRIGFVSPLRTKSQRIVVSRSTFLNRRTKRRTGTSFELLSEKVFLCSIGVSGVGCFHRFKCGGLRVEDLVGTFERRAIAWFTKTCRNAEADCQAFDQLSSLDDQIRLEWGHGGSLPRKIFDETLLARFEGCIGHKRSTKSF